MVPSPSSSMIYLRSAEFRFGSMRVIVIISTAASAMNDNVVAHIDMFFTKVFGMGSAMIGETTPIRAYTSKWIEA